jgi:catechol 2,3-dioxygenase-like lactoylglutathione lyase family enzyme
MIRLDHIAIEARDAQASARALAHILGTGEPAADGADGDMFRLDLENGAFLLFNTSQSVNPAHIAFRVDATRFAEVVARLRGRNVPFGNDPEAPANGLTSDPLSGQGRVYFVDENGHLFEVSY